MSNYHCFDSNFNMLHCMFDIYIDTMYNNNNYDSCLILSACIFDCTLGQGFCITWQFVVVNALFVAQVSLNILELLKKLKLAGSFKFQEVNYSHPFSGQDSKWDRLVNRFIIYILQFCIMWNYVSESTVVLSM